MARRFGRIVVKDPRDAKYSIRRGKPSRRTQRYWNDGYAWLDQGELPACVGFSWSHWLLNAPLRQYLDPAFIYNVAKFYDEYKGENYDGTSVRAGAKVLALAGFIQEYRWAKTLDDVIQTLLEVGPLVVGTTWYEGMSEPVAGRLAVTGQAEGGHAYLLTGVSLKTGLVRIKNSWSQDWGQGGHGYLPLTDFQKLLADDGEACIAFESDPFKALKRAS
jgi:hypothetical protein